ncbi:Hypothetical predicted protein [Paramuricea clavata]|uniref:Uncharacterized protein n=1 Tax=Paramuricea clavata TaxID=317549 RepID=A0A6S7GA42_PARCT|nr:Hypothetical predicted protein [Paramuricea clavata]
MKRKRKYKDEKAAAAVPPIGDGANAPPAAAAAGAVVGTVAYHHDKIIKHFKARNVKESDTGTLQLKDKVTNISYDDLVKDLTHNYKKKKMHLSETQQTYALSMLRRTGMPASYIRNEILHDKYRNLLQTPPHQQQHAAGPQPPATPYLVPPKPIKKKRILGASRDWMDTVDDIFTT